MQSERRLYKVIGLYCILPVYFYLELVLVCIQPVYLIFSYSEITLISISYDKIVFEKLIASLVPHNVGSFVILYNLGDTQQ